MDDNDQEYHDIDKDLLTQLISNGSTEEIKQRLQDMDIDLHNNEALIQAILEEHPDYVKATTKGDLY